MLIIKLLYKSDEPSDRIIGTIMVSLLYQKPPSFMVVYMQGLKL